MLIGTSLFIGDISLSFHDFWRALFDSHSNLAQFIFFHMRLPHTLNAFVIGCLLALAGYLMQIMLSNPLADPYTLGTTGGAAVFTLIGMLIGLDGYWMIGASFIGSIISMLILFFIVGNLKEAAPSQLLLMGVVLSTGWGALLSLLLVLSPAGQTKSILYWLFGDIDSQQYPTFTVFCLLLGIGMSILLQKELHVLRQGSLLAKTLGVDTEKLQFKLILISSLLTACAVSMGGTIGFIGLIVPHLARMLLKTNQQLLLPCTLFMGGCLLLVADIFSRLIIAPEQLPIGVLTSFIGIPFFVWLSRK